VKVKRTAAAGDQDHPGQHLAVTALAIWSAPPRWQTLIINWAWGFSGVRSASGPQAPRAGPWCGCRRRGISPVGPWLPLILGLAEFGDRGAGGRRWPWPAVKVPATRALSRSGP
jgi:hypothetical protein